ncbi:MAG: hypothetical protein U0269_36810 [Polyangiales bacterium]
MRTSIRAAGALLAAFALVHCGGPQPTTDAGRDGSSSTPDAAGDSGSRPDSSTGPSSAGAACTDDTMCNGLTCDTSIKGGFCSAMCTNNASQPNEQGQCGGSGSTCLSIGDGADATQLCTKACRPSTAGSCRAGYVCTGFWYTHMGANPDAAGCFPFCSTNDHCNTGEQCNPRTGSCSMTAPNPNLLADGLPCTVPAMNAPSPCRGICFRVSDTGNTGICGSFLNMATDRECRDEPTVMSPLGRSGTDNLALCIFRSCSTTQCCPNGTVCEGQMAGDTEGLCGIDDPAQPNIACTPGTDGGTGSDAAADAAADVATGG